MSFKEDFRYATLFSKKSNDSLDRARMNFNYSLSQIATPYYDLTSNVKAIGHPFFHATQLLRDAARFAYGAVVLVAALATFNFSAAGKAGFGMLQLIKAACTEILNIALSIVSLVTRFVASIFNFGYASTSIQLRGAHLRGATDTTNNRYEALGLAAINGAAKRYDETEHQEVFSLI